MAERQMDRRGWFRWAVKGIAAGCAAGWALALARFTKARPVSDLSRRVVVGAAADIPEGATVHLSQLNGYLVHGAAGFYALSGRCTHLGCSVAQDPEGFVCPCHGAKFDGLGRPVAGPAPTSLVWYRVALDAQDHVVVHFDQQVSLGTYTVQ